MKIGVIAPGAVPHAVGGAERLYDGLVKAFNELTPHDAELVMVPSPEHSFRQLVDSYETFHELDVSAFDLVVSTKYPSWMVRHPRHVVYMLHPLRGLYDSYHHFAKPTAIDTSEPEVMVLTDLLRSRPLGTASSASRILATARWVVDSLGDDHPACAFPGPLVRALVHWLDHDALHPSRVQNHFAISRRVTQRDDYFPRGANAVSVPPPSSLQGLYPGPYETFFTASRLDGPKRIDLLINAMQHVPHEIELRIAGTGPDEERLRSLRPSDHRIVFLGRISEEALRSEYSRALAVPFVPLDEDFGLVTVEAQHAAKPVITCTDSGGVTELVDHRRNGFIVAPDPRAIAGAMNELVSNPSLAPKMGEAGTADVASITWQNVVNSLLKPPRATPRAEVRATPRHSAQRSRPRVVMLSTYPAHPARGGGQIRLNRLAAGLSKRFDVDILTLDDAGGAPGVTELRPHLRQTVIARSAEHRSAEDALAARSPIPIGDIAASLFADQTPDFMAALRRATSDAECVILEQPYLLPALRRVSQDIPHVYDSQNAEAAMKTMLMAGHHNAADLVAVVNAVERHAVQSAALVVTCSTNDRLTLESTAPTLADWALAPNGADVFDIDFVTGDQRTGNRRRLIHALNGRTEKAFERLALFVASYHPPNLEAAEMIVGLASTLPHIAFLLVGSHGDYFRSWRLPDNVIIGGMASDRSLRRMLSSADVALNPMMSGGGTNLKLVEYFAAGAPVVSSTLGIRGVDVRDGEHLVLADEANHLARAIDALVGDPLGSSRRASSARMVVEQGYDWSTISAGFTEEIWKVAERS